jgi:hypothetical protein
MQNSGENQVLVNILCELQKAKESLRDNTRKLATLIKREYAMGNKLVINDMRAESPTSTLICLYDNKNILHLMDYENITDVIIEKEE